jgi:hypothetical protein
VPERETELLQFGLDDRIVLSPQDSVACRPVCHSSRVLISLMLVHDDVLVFHNRLTILGCQRLSIKRLGSFADAAAWLRTSVRQRADNVAGSGLGAPDHDVTAPGKLKLSSGPPSRSVVHVSESKRLVWCDVLKRESASATGMGPCSTTSS